MKIHPEYLYDKVNYINNRTSIIIGCKKHGYFSINPKVFLKEEYKCNECKKEEKLIKQGNITINKLKEKYPMYNYDNAVYSGRHQDVDVICQIHGSFKQNVGNALNNEFCGCRKCGIERSAKSRETSFDEFVRRANDIHNNKFIYVKEKFREIPKKAWIICPYHGGFWGRHKFSLIRIRM